MQSYQYSVAVGRLTKDPESKSLKEVNKTSFTLAVNRSYLKEDGERDADFFQVVAWGKLGEICQQYLKKGRLVLIEGRFQTRSYEKDGRRNYVTELIAEKMLMLESAERNNSKAISSVKEEMLELQTA